MADHLLVKTRVGGERFAETSLHSVFNGSVYFPKVKIRYSKQRELARLFLPRFGFVAFDEDTVSVERIRAAPGVSRILSSEFKLARIAQCVIDSIRRREVNGFIPMPPSLRRHNDFKYGDIVRVFDGKFKGRNGLFERWEGRKAVITTEFFNRAVTTRIDPQAIRRIAP